MMKTQIPLYLSFYSISQDCFKKTKKKQATFVSHKTQIYKSDFKKKKSGVTTIHILATTLLSKVFDQHFINNSDIDFLHYINRSTFITCKTDEENH